MSDDISHKIYQRANDGATQIGNIERVDTLNVNTSIILPHDEIIVKRYLNALLTEIPATINGMLFLSARANSTAVNPPARILPYITTSPLQPSYDRTPILPSEAHTFDNFQKAFEAMHERILLLGVPGAGKTTTLLQFAYQAAKVRLQDSTQPIPLFASLHRWDHKTPVSQWAQSTVVSEFRGIRLDDYPLLYILDGLDELGGERPVTPERPDEDKYDPRLQLLQDIAEQLPTASVVISCRQQDYEQIGEKATLRGAVTLLPLERDQVEHFLNVRNQSNLWSALRADNHLMELVRTPLLLALLSGAIGENNTQVPLNISHLTANSIFDFYIKQRFAHESLKRTLPYNEQITRTMLSNLGAAMWKDYWSPATELDFPKIHNILGEQGQKFMSFACSMNFLRESSYGKLQFVHLRFRDYCSVFSLLEALQDKNAVVREDTALILGKIADAAAIPALVKTLRDEDRGVRWSAALSLEEIRDAAAVPALLQVLKDKDRGVRERASAALDKIGVAAVPALLQALNDENPVVRQGAISTLGKIGAAAVPALLQALDHENSSVRWSAVSALGKIGAAAVPALLQAFDHEDTMVRLGAISALGEIGDAVAVPALLQALKDKDARIQERASVALGYIKM